MTVTSIIPIIITIVLTDAYSIQQRRDHRQTTAGRGGRLTPPLPPPLAVRHRVLRSSDHDWEYRDNGSLSSSSRPVSSSNVIDIGENAERDIQSMMNWAEQCGVQCCNGFEIVPTTSTVHHQQQHQHGDDSLYRDDVSVVTYEDLEAGSPVVWVPTEMILSSYRCYDEFGGYLEQAETLLKSLNIYKQRRHFALMIKILIEYERGVESPWFQWLNSLPRYFTNGVSMTDFCLECLPPLVSSLVMKERTRMKKMLNLQKVPFLRDDTKNNPDLIKWAYQIVYTRAFDYNAISTNSAEGQNYDDNDHDGADDDTTMSDLCIVPVVDIFNHGGGIGTEIGISFDKDGNCLAKTTSNVPAGTPLRIRYSDPTNPSFLFARYGFVDEYSPATFCKLMYPHVNQQLKDIGYAFNRVLFYRDTGDVSHEVWDVLLYQLLGSANAARRREFYLAHMNGDDETKYMMHQQYYSETCQQLLHHIDMTVLELDELSARADGRDVREHPRLPLILRHNEFVRRTFLRVRARYFE